MNNEQEFCPRCWGHHAPDSPDMTVGPFRGWIFTPPFHCVCCGKGICAQQFAFGRACGPCDMGACDSRNSAYREDYAHEMPEWWRPLGQEMVDAFAEIVGAERAGR